MTSFLRSQRTFLRLTVMPTGNINGYPVVFSFYKEPNPEAFERIRNILLATSYTKKVG